MDGVGYLDSSSTEFLAKLQSAIHCTLDITLQPTTKVLEHGGPSGQDNVLRHIAEKAS